MVATAFPSDEIATVVVRGQAYSNWETVRVDFEVGRPYQEFQFTAVEAIEGNVLTGQVSNLSGVQIYTGDAVQILLGGQMIIGAADSGGAFNARVEIRQSAYSESAHAIMLYGRDHAANCVDCSAHFAEGQGQFINETFGSIASAVLGTVGVSLVLPEGDNGYVYPYFSVAPGETPWAAVERLARYQPGMRCQSDGSGNLVCDFLGQRGFTAGFEFVEGKNIKESTAMIDITKTMGMYEARAQQPPTDSHSSSDVTENQGFAIDPTVDQTRYNLQMCEEPATSQGCTERALHEMTFRGQEIIHCTVKVYGWYEQSGKLFDISQPYGIWSPMHNLYRTLWSRKVTFEQSNEKGTTTTIELCTPESLSSNGFIPAAGPGAFARLGPQDPANGAYFGQGVTLDQIAQVIGLNQ